MENASSGRTTAVGRKVGNPFLIALAGLMLSAGASNAQPTSQGSVVVAAGANSNGFSAGQPFFQVTGAGEALIQNRVGLGGELGLARGGRDTWATVSLNGRLYFPREGNRNGVAPFVSGGYTTFFTGSGGIAALDVGGGVTYWFNDRTGLLLEFRDALSQPLGPNHYWTARIGIAFR
jgi:hypothetical protein